MKLKMKKFIFTFGCGQEHAGYCQPIYAPNSEMARQKMFELHGAKWAFQYNEVDWEEVKSRGRSLGYSTEIELDPICVDYYVITGILRNNKRFKPIYTQKPQNYNIWCGTIWKIMPDGSRRKVKTILN